MQKIKVLGVCGSLRAESWNLKLLHSFLGALPSARYECAFSPSLELPLLNEELEKAPLHPRILAFREALAAAPVVAIASPEYNGAYSPALKNAIDWATRPPGNLWQGKIVVLLSASPGSLGGARGLIPLRTLLSGIKAWVLPEQVQCAGAETAFAGARLQAEPVIRQISAAESSLQAFCAKMLASPPA